MNVNWFTWHEFFEKDSFDISMSKILIMSIQHLKTYLRCWCQCVCGCWMNTLFIYMDFSFHVLSTCVHNMLNGHVKWTPICIYKILSVLLLTHLWCFVLGHYYLINIIDNFDNNITKKCHTNVIPYLTSKLTIVILILNMLGVMKHMI
jgi:hypothetical protein